MQWTERLTRIGGMSYSAALCEVAVKEEFACFVSEANP
tara:strand:+ start:58 stop:171 length:114 start_codon:yes stop_codon:yes gene_type:complete